MRFGVLVASKGRPDDLARLLESLRSQTVRPAYIGLSLTSPADLPRSGLDNDVSVVFGSAGSSIQRNRAVAAGPGDLDVWAFLDDDLIVGAGYVAAMLNVFSRFPDVVGAEGLLQADGAATGVRVSPQRAIDLLAAPACADRVEAVSHLYGCNMVVRASAASGIWFDEALPMYSYLEDRDYSVRLARKGRLVRVHGAQAVHLASPSSRVGGRALGYAQVANPVHLRRKGTFVGFSEVAVTIAKPVAKNALLSMGGPDAQLRRARASGNMIAFSDWARGRISPARMVDLL